MDTDLEKEEKDDQQNEDWEMGYEYELTKYKYGHPTQFLEVLKKRKASYFMKETTETTTIIFHNTRFLFTHSTAFPKNKLFLFKLVKDDAVKWCAERERIVLPPKNETIKFNLNYKESIGEITGTDLNHAYWRIAFMKGIINERTYEYGLDPSCKALRLATISVLGKKKKFVKYVDGYKQEIITATEGDEKLRLVYDFVRFYCYGLMKEMADLLKDDFESWKTDCIYYRNKPENIQKIHKYLDKRGISYKQLTH